MTTARKEHEMTKQRAAWQIEIDRQEAESRKWRHYWLTHERVR